MCDPATRAIYAPSVLDHSVFCWFLTCGAVLEDKGTSGEAAPPHHNKVYALYINFKREGKAVQITLIISI